VPATSPSEAECMGLMVERVANSRVADEELFLQAREVEQPSIFRATSFSLEVEMLFGPAQLSDNSFVDGSQGPAH
jgi:hypothetical protein